MNAQEKINMSMPVSSMIIRGKIITDNLIEVGGRGGDLQFLTPDAHKYVEQLPLGNPIRLADLYALKFDEILDYLEELGTRLDIEKNDHLRRARELSYMTAPTTPPLVDAVYAKLKKTFQREKMYEEAEKSIGIRYLEGWVPEKTVKGSTINIRCFGARTVHIVAGNSPIVSAMTIVRNAMLRSDAIIKAPSNDPFTALAVAQTMCEMDPNHPITKHLSVAYWRGGDTALEEKLYQPHNIEKIIAWGGFASVKHVTRYIQPGLELISLDPKRSASIIGREALESEEMMRAAAVRLATDIGGANQNACVNARVAYVMSGTDDAGLAKINKLGQYVYDALMNLPRSVSTKPKRYDSNLKDHVEAVRLEDEWYKVIGGKDDEGAIIVSQIPEPVGFATALIDRTANLVPVDTMSEVLGAVNSYTQTIGIFPESMKRDLVNMLPLCGAQRMVSLGYATGGGADVGPHDAIEPLRRMGRWIIDEVASPETVPALWEAKA
jgi:hypothetical protein